MFPEIGDKMADVQYLKKFKQDFYVLKNDTEKDKLYWEPVSVKPLETFVNENCVIVEFGKKKILEIDEEFNDYLIAKFDSKLPYDYNDIPLKNLNRYFDKGLAKIIMNAFNSDVIGIKNEDDEGHIDAYYHNLFIANNMGLDGDLISVENFLDDDITEKISKLKYSEGLGSLLLPEKASVVMPKLFKALDDDSMNGELVFHTPLKIYEIKTKRIYDD